MESKHKPDYGRFILTAGKFYGDAEKDKGEGELLGPRGAPPGPEARLP